MDLQIRVRTVDGVTILDVAGEVDLYTAPQLEEGLRKAAGAPAPLLAVNLSEVAYLDSTALRVLTNSHKQVQQSQGAMVVIAGQPTVQKIFRITGLVTVLHIVATEREAMELLKAHPPSPPGG